VRPERGQKTILALRGVADRWRLLTRDTGRNRNSPRDRRLRQREFATMSGCCAFRRRARWRAVRCARPAGWKP